jgi:exonuclease III
LPTHRTWKWIAVVRLSEKVFFGNIKLPKIQIISQNCNSLNLASPYAIRNKKIVSITSLDADVILLSDVRAGKCFKNVADLFKFHYRTYINSTQARRGVGILIKNNSPIQVVDSFRDEQENIILLKCKVDSVVFVLGAVYGPNTDDREFFVNLNSLLKLCNTPSIILGGDWNTTPSSLPASVNPDVFSMVSIPSKKRSDWLTELCEDFDLYDVFRHLHGNKRDYSYVPYGQKKNRSRIDFFLVSESLVNSVRECKVGTWHNKKVFDHCHVILNTGKQFKKGKLSMNNRILKHPLLEYFVILSLYECYISNIHFSRFEARTLMVEDSCLDLDRVDTMLAELLHLCDSWSWKPTLSEDDLQIRDEKIAEIDQILTEIIDLDTLSNMPKKIDDDEFFEKLIKVSNNAVLTLQKRSLFEETASKRNLVKKLDTLKGDFTANIEEIKLVENRISTIIEGELQDKISNYLKTDILNNEKITPKFLNLAKSRVADNLSQIKRDDGTDFANSKERSNHIRDFYKNLYRKPPEFENVDFSGCVESFLGPEITNNPVVQALKLSGAERASLDLPISLDELDESIKKVNVNSAPGPDGVSNKFIIRFWKFFRYPLLKYANACFEKGVLTDTFRTACIKLIPKKGDTSKVKNWRPISLLSCYYKILSRVINNRLGTVINRITSRSQKAYTNGRYLHEVTININNAISHCIQNNVPGAIVSIDQQKAFDSILHEFCDEAFRFFGIGEKFISMMNTLGTNRTACIILEDGSLSDPFDLERGRAQGDCPSPRQYNIGEQICLLKIEFDPQIEKIGFNDNVTHAVVGPDPDPHPRLPGAAALGPDPDPLMSAARDSLPVSKISLETNGINLTEKTDAFADDTSVFTTQKKANFVRLREILSDFGKISGLYCNLEKTTVMLIGPTVDNMSNEIKALGFQVTNKMTALGVDYENSLQLELNNCNKMLTKIKKVAGDWGRFPLSIIGRIAVSKTFLISQTTFLGEVFTPNRAILNEMQTVINNFVLRGVPWAADKLYDAPKNGGLGLLNIEQLLISLKCAWFKRIYRYGVRDTWSYNLMKNCFFSAKCFRKAQLSATRPIEYNIGLGFWTFLEYFWRNNISEAPIFCNPLVTKGVDHTGRFDSNPIGTEFLGIENFQQCPEKVLSLCIGDVFLNDEFVDFHRLNEILGFRLNFNKYAAIRRAVFFTVRKYNTPNIPNKISLLQILRARSKGCSIFRKQLLSVDFKGMNQIRKFCGLLEIGIPNIISLQHNLGLWNNCFIPIGIRNFAMQLFRNSLPVGARLNHRTPFEINEGCRLCSKKVREGIQFVPDRETFQHFFLHCEVTSNLLRIFCDNYYPTLADNDRKNLVYLGLDTDGNYSVSDRIVTLLLLFEIWQSRTNKSVSSIATIELNMVQNMQCMLANCKKLKNIFCSTNSLWFRRWWPAQIHRE